MAESPSRGGAPTADDAPDATPATKGASDPLFNPPGLKTRRTVMGLAPAPHLGGAKGGATQVMGEAEDRKQRVLARIASMEGNVTGPPPPIVEEVGTTLIETEPPPRSQSSPPAGVSPAQTASMQPKFGTGTMLMHGSPVPRHISSERALPSPAGWEVHDAKGQVEPPEVATEVIEPAPITARLPAAAAPMLAARSRSVPPARSVPPPQPAALAVRTYEPSYAPRPSLGHLNDPRLVILAEPNSNRAASYRLLRDNLLQKGMPRVLAVSSATPGDGKTTCATNLAFALAEMSSTRVLLIDANYFEPELGSLFAIERLGAIVPPDGNASWLDPYKLVEITPGLHVAAIERRKGEPPPRFDQQRFEAMIDRLVRVSYDYIVIDTPAMRRTPAVIQLLAVADATLMAVRSGGTVGRDLRRAVEQIPQKKAFGLALIDAPQHE